MKFFLNNIQINPIDGLNVGLHSDFKIRSNPEELKLSTLTLIIPREGVQIIRDWIDQNGLGNGIPAHVETKDGTIIRYYADLWDPSTKPTFKTLNITGLYEGITTQLKLKRRDSNFFDQAKGWSFEMLADAGVNFTLTDIDYIIIKDNAVELGISLSLGIFNVTREIINQSQALTQTVIAIIKATTANVDPGENVEDIISLTVRAVAQIVVIGLLLFALIKLSQQFFELIFPKVRTFQGCKVKELMTKASAHFGFEFKSELLDSLPGLAILPLPLIKDKDSWWDYLMNDLNFAYTKGYPTAKDASVSLVSDLFDTMATALNGATKVTNNCVQFELWDHWKNITPNNIELNVNLDDENLNEWSYNTEEAFKRRLVQYQTDASDIHTLDFFDPTVAERSLENTNVPNSDLETITGYENVNIPFALGVRKNKLNWFETLAKQFFKGLDGLINSFGGSSSFEAKINARKGKMQISQQFYGIPKLMYIVNGSQPENYVDIIGANAINDNYYSRSDVSKIAGRILKNVPIRIRPNDFVNLLTNNFINNGKAEILDIQFFDEEEIETQTTATVKIFDDWSEGKQVIKIIGE